MTQPSVLALTTYPVRNPLHGGQRRVRALLDLYGRLGATATPVAVYDPAYTARDVDARDIKLGYSGARWAGVPFVSDLQAGEFAAQSPEAYRHFVSLAESLRPDVITLEQPWMWPLVQRLRAEGRLSGVRLVYSSQNWEAPLKSDILLGAGVDPQRAADVAAHVEALERQVVAASDLVLAVSSSDAATYRAIPNAPRVVLAPNGVARMPSPLPPSTAPDVFGGGRFIFFVGSAYPPNIEGFGRLVAPEGLYFVPPRKSVAVCGGLCEELARSEVYQRYVSGNTERVQFYPNVSDPDLWALRRDCHAIVLPIHFGGGSNLKTAEALVSGKWIVATTTALRGYESFRDAPGMIIADTPDAFRTAMIDVLKRDPLVLHDGDRRAREVLHWEEGLRASGAEGALRVLLEAGRVSGASA